MHPPELDEKSRELLKLWREARGNDPLPHYSFINPLKLRKWVGNLTVVRLREGPKRFFVSVHGANIARDVGSELQNRYLEDVFAGPTLPATLAPYELSMERCEAILSTQKLAFPNELVQSLVRLVLPCCGTNTANAERFLVYIQPVNIRPEITRSYRTSLNAFLSQGKAVQGELSQLYVLDEEDGLHSVDQFTKIASIAGE